MPRNIRPGYFTPGYRDYQFGQLQDAQNVYDLLKAQEEANGLASEKLRMEKEKYLEEQKRINEAEEEAEELAKNKKKMISTLKKELKLMELCREAGLDYNLLNGLRMKIVELTKSRTMNRLQRQLAEAKDQLDYDTKKLNSESCRVTSLDKFVKLLGGNPYHIKQREFEEKCVEQYTNDIKNYKKLIRKERNKIENKLDEYFKPINEFRATHYNEDIDTIFKLAPFKLEAITVTGEGTSEDYNKFLTEYL